MWNDSVLYTEMYIQVFTVKGTVTCVLLFCHPEVVAIFTRLSPGRLCFPDTVQEGLLYHTVDLRSS